ncbi:hypothetical protein [Rhizomonospora bruguierae]|uniref:hypothetical protein n=1 Tax=Rhizomonospora bruguierae TaxID=1581705 RepID=UPI001BD08410|nr:hypothetical protein [Micromonospora sp. NBRC 107566]
MRRSSVYPAAGSAAAGNGIGGCSAMTESKVTSVAPTVPEVQCAAPAPSRPAPATPRAS